MLLIVTRYQHASSVDELSTNSMTCITAILQKALFVMTFFNYNFNLKIKEN